MREETSWHTCSTYLLFCPRQDPHKLGRVPVLSPCSGTVLKSVFISEQATSLLALVLTDDAPALAIGVITLAWQTNAATESALVG